MRKIYSLRSSSTGLVGAALNIMAKDMRNYSDVWPDNSAHLDAQIDSYYEYIIKCFLIFKDEECLKWWQQAIQSIDEYLLYTDNSDRVWWQRVDMNNGTIFGNNSRHFSYRYSLHAHFMAATWALDETLDIQTAIANQEANHYMWSIHGITPFEYDFDEDVVISPQYDLNPEIFESNCYLYVKRETQCT